MTTPVDSSVIRALQLLEYVHESPDGLSFSALLDCSGVPRATLARQLKELAAHGYLSKDGERGAYRIGPAMRRLQTASTLLSVLRLHAPPVLAQLTAETGQSAAVFVRDGLELLCLCKVAHPESLAMQIPGQRSPDFSRNPWGWLLWPGLGESERRQLAPLQLDASLLERADLIRRDDAGDWALDDGIGIAGVRRLAVGIGPDASTARACIGMAGLAGALTDAHLSRVIVPRLQTAAAELAGRIQT